MDIKAGRIYKQRNPTVPFQTKLRYEVTGVFANEIHFCTVEGGTDRPSFYEYTPEDFEKYLAEA